MPSGPRTTRPCLDCGVPFEAGPDARWGACCRWKHRGKRAKYVWTQERDDLLRLKYDGRKGSIDVLAHALGFSRWAIKSRVIALGLVRPRVGRPWSQEEDAFLDEHLGVRLAAWIARKLGRTTTSVVMRIKRRKLSRSIREGYSMRDLEACFGINHKEIQRWVRLGWLRGRHRYSERAEAAWPTEAWRFTDADLRTFVREHPTDFRLDRVDQLWFLDLVFEGRVGATVQKVVA